MIKEGHAALNFYIILSGQVDVLKKRENTLIRLTVKKPEIFVLHPQYLNLTFFLFIYLAVKQGRFIWSDRRRRVPFKS